MKAEPLSEITQVRFTKEQMEALRKMAFDCNMNLSAFIRAVVLLAGDSYAGEWEKVFRRVEPGETFEVVRN